MKIIISFYLTDCFLGGGFFFIEFIGVRLVNKMIQVSGEQFYYTSSDCCIVCLQPKVKSTSITVYPPFTLFYFPHALSLW